MKKTNSTSKQRKPASTKASNPRQRRAPTRYSKELGDQICELLADGKTLRAACRQLGMADERSVRRWALDADHPFAKQYEQARFVGYFAMADDIVDISDDSASDWIEREGKDGKSERVIDHENVQRSRLRTENRKWLLSKALPKVFGDKLELSGKDGRSLGDELGLSSEATLIKTARWVADLLSRADEMPALPEKAA
jgi:hypothetical protein